MLLIATIICGACSSCGDDEDSSSTNSLSSLPDAAKHFVGLWQVLPESSAYKTYPEIWAFFSQDGKARIQEMNYERSGWNHGPNYRELHSTPKLNWTYDEAEKLLATDYAKGIWKITISTQNTWAGFAQWGESKSIYNAQKVVSPHLNFITTAGGTWKDKDGNTITFLGNDEYGKTGENDGKIALTWSITYMLDDREIKLIGQKLENPRTYEKGSRKGEFSVDSEKIVYKSGTYYYQSKLNKDKGYDGNYKNITILNHER